MDWLNYTLFTIGSDTPVLLIDLLTSVLGLTCVFLAGRNSKYNFWVGYLYTIGLTLMFFNKHLYASLLLQPLSLGINVLGHYRWSHPRKGEEVKGKSDELKVTMLGWKSRAILLVLVPLFAVLWGWLLLKLGRDWCPGYFSPDPIPYLDALVTVLILTAQLLSALKKWECWILWLFVNIAQVTMHLMVGHVFMPIVCALYLINGIVSLVGWMKLYRKENQ